MSSSKAGKGTSEEANKKYEWATEILHWHNWHGYEMNWHSRAVSRTTSWEVYERMDAAKAKDGESSSTLNRLKEKMVPLKEVRFEPSTFCSCSCRDLEAHHDCRVPYIEVPS